MEEKGHSDSNSDKDDKNDLTHSNQFTPIMPLWQQFSPVAWNNMYNEYIKYTTRMTEIYNEYIKSSERMAELYKELAANTHRMTELYKESAKSTEKITNYWSDFFWKPLSAAKKEEE
jgi:esterase/lipase